jgi:Ras-related protein Rab-1A
MHIKFTQSGLGLDFISVKYKTPEGKEIPVKIWDTAGQERFKTITYSFYRQAQGVLIAFDVTNRESFENVKNWIDSIDNHAKPNIHKVLIGNKIDLVDDRKISTKEAKSLADEHGLPYFETSAKLDKNVSEVMDFIMSKVYETSQKPAEENNEEIRGSQLQLQKPASEEKDDCKC